MPPPQQPYYQAPPKPGVIPLRPLGVGEILDGAITTIRRYPKQMLGLSALVAVVSNVLSVGTLTLLRTQTGYLSSDLPPNATDLDVASDNLRIALLATIPGAVINLFIQVVLAGMLTIVVGKAILGQSITLGEAWRQVIPRFWPLLGASLLYTLMIIVGTVALVIPAVWLYVLFSLTSNALILEGAKVGRAFGRSRELVNQAWWRTFGILLLASLITGILAYIVSIPFTLITGGLGTPTMSLGATILIVTIGQIIADTIVQPFVCGVTTLVYIDRRIRREGLDIQLARQAAG